MTLLVRRRRALARLLPQPARDAAREADRQRGRPRCPPPLLRRRGRRPGTLITCLEYPELDEGSVGRGSTHHFALAVESEEELEAWRGYLVCQGIPVTDVLDRTYFKSLYLRDPDGHIVELATVGPGLTVDEPAEELGRKPVAGGRGSGG